MGINYLSILANVICENWDAPALSEIDLYSNSSKLHYSYGELFGRIKWLEEYYHNIGIKKGVHIAICGHSSANWAVVYLSLLTTQHPAITIIPTLSKDDIVKQLSFSDCKLLFVDDMIWNDIQSIIPDSILDVISLADFRTIRGNDKIEKYHSLNRSQVKVHWADVNIEDLAVICFSSGTTSAPKGVMLPHRSINANVCYRYDRTSTYCGKNAISLLPFAHVYGQIIDVLLSLCVGMHLHIFTEFPPVESLLFGLRKIQPTTIMLVPMILENVVSKLNAKGLSIDEMRRYVLNLFGSNIDLVGLGGAALSPLLDSVVSYKNGPFAICYGMTECGTRIAMAIEDMQKVGSVGPFVPTLKGQISSNGEILVRGENVMLGYYKNPEATAAKIDKDGWLHTGDRGHLDEDGFLYVEGRLNQDMIVLPSGENIHPENIESIINKIEGVEESLVLNRNGKLMALVRIKGETSIEKRNNLLAMVNPLLPPYAQLFGMEFISEPLARTEKRTIKRYLYQ